MVIIGMNGTDQEVPLTEKIISMISEGGGQQPAEPILSIKEFTRRIVAGDETAFSQFYDLYSTRLFRLLLILTRRNESLAREIQQTVLIKVARKFKVFDAETELWAWLAQVARNAYVDYVRKEARVSGSEILNLSLIFVFSEEIIRDTDDHLLKCLDQGLESLPPEDRALIEKSYFHNLAQNNIASATGKSRKAVESKLARIRKKLRQFIVQTIHHEQENS